MLDIEKVIDTIRELYSLLETSDRKADILTSVLKEANADYEAALQELEKIRDELEERVTERTAALAAANEELIREVAERRQTELALRQSEERYRTLIESSFDGIFVQKDGRIAFANIRLSEMLGYEAGELEGQDHLKIYHPDDRALICQRAEARSRGDPVPSNYEIRLIRKDESAFEVELAAKVVEFGGGRGVQVCARDITERKRLEEQLRQAQRLEAVGRLAGGIAHDFNNLLTVMLGYADVLSQRMVSDHPFYESIGQIRTAAERASDLTRQLLAFSRKQVLELRILDLNRTVLDFERILGRVVGEDVELVTDLDSSLERVRADPGQVEQILMNLAVNARDAMPNGGKLILETSNVFVDEDYAGALGEVTPGKYVAISVSDTGHGVDRGTLSKIFDPFFTTKEKHKGTGLGLSTVYGIVKQHGGHVSVYSELGKGTTFRVCFPSVSGAREDRTSVDAAEASRPLGKETVLVVEDEPIVRRLACDFLASLGYTVLSASDPEEAMAISNRQEGTIHLLFTDVVMPQMDGTELFSRLSPLRPHMKVLYVSGYSQHAIARHGALKEGIHFLPKPFTIDSLARKVRNVLDDS